MHIVLIIGAVGVGYLLLRRPLNSPTTFSQAGPNIPLSPQPAPVDASLQGEVTTLQQEILALTPKPVDPLAPPAPTLTPDTSDLVNHSLFPNIQLPVGTDWHALQEAEASETNLNPKDFDAAHNTRYCGEIKAGHTLAWNPATRTFDNWEGGYQPGNALALVGAGTNMALSVTSRVVGNLAQAGGQAAGVIANAIPFVGIAVSGIVGLFSAISAHHAAAVKAENTAYNNSLVTVENYMAIIINAVGSGQSTPDEGIAALDSMYSDFLKATPPPLRNNSPYCNGLCEAKIIVQAMVIYWKAYFNQVLLSGNGLGNVRSHV